MQNQDQFLHALPGLLASIFDQTQSTLATHSRNCTSIYKLHLRASAVTSAASPVPVQSKAPLRDITTRNTVTNMQNKARKKQLSKPGESRFNGAFHDMVYRILAAQAPQKKSVSANLKAHQECEECVEKSIKFIGTYAIYLKNKETTSSVLASRSETNIYVPFMDNLLLHLLPGLCAAETTTRARVVSLVHVLLDSIDADNMNLSEQWATTLLDALLLRATDKDSSIRAFAIASLTRLHQAFPATRTHVMAKLSDLLDRDAQGHIRHLILAFLLIVNPLNSDAGHLAAILKRTRDTDSSVRLLALSIFNSVSTSRKKVPSMKISLLTLGISQRIDIIERGLSDPDPDVINFASVILVSTFQELQERTHSLFEALCEFALAFLDYRKLASKALMTLFNSPQFEMDAVFPATADSLEFWVSLKPVQALVMHSFMEYFHVYNVARRLEAANFPPLVMLATCLQHHYDSVMLSFYDPVQAPTQANLVRTEKDVLEREDQILVVDYVLKLGARFDFSDELGRRKMFSVCTEMLAHPTLPSSLLEPCLELMNIVMGNERDFVRIVVEAIVDMRDVLDDDATTLGASQSSDNSRSTRRRSISCSSSATGDRSFRHAKEWKEMSAEEKTEADKKDLRSLEMTVGMLRKVKGTMRDNETLEGLLADLVVPSVKRQQQGHQDDNIREWAMAALGLLCLSSEELARSSISLIVNQFHVDGASEVMKRAAMRAVCDIAIMLWETCFDDNEKDLVKSFLLSVARVDEGIMRRFAIEGICKILVWYGDHKELLREVLEVMIAAVDEDVSKLLECFVRTYCQVNRARVEDVQPFLVSLLVIRESPDDGRSGRLCSIVVDASKENDSCNVKLALDVLRALGDASLSKAYRALVCEQVLDKLSLGEMTAGDRDELNETLEQCAVSDKMLSKFRKRLRGL